MKNAFAKLGPARSRLYSQVLTAQRKAMIGQIWPKEIYELFPQTELKRISSTKFCSRHLRSASVSVGFGKPNIRFLPDGTLKSVELRIMNLRRAVKKDSGTGSQLLWEEVIIVSLRNNNNH